MKSRLLFLLKYSLFWLIFFLFIKTFFWVFNFHFAKSFSFRDITGIYFYGIKLDLSAVCYLLLFPFLLIFPTIFFQFKYYKPILRFYTYFLITVISFLVVADLELYKYWMIRLDTTPILYLKTPKNALASVEWYVIVRQLFIMAMMIFFFIQFYKSKIEKEILKINKGRWFETPVLLILFASLIIPIRGGFGMPLNTGSAYFSQNEFANHSAINLLWNVGFSLTEMETMKNPYKEIDDSKADSIVKSLYTNKQFSEVKVLNNERPNIILIIVESFTAKAIEPLGGIKGITPRFNKLIHEGILFQNFYSSGIRSDRGIVSILSGFPSLPAVAIMNFPEKTASLPFLTKDLKKQGYNSAYYYGGDIDFVSMRSYVTNAGFEKIISMSDFQGKYARWGVHDHVVLNRFFDDINNVRSPFFYTIFTLSSHEPFDVPIKQVIAGDDWDHKFLNSVYYTDSCIGDFIEKAKKTVWWKNTLVIITADHGCIFPNYTANFDPLRFHVPMLWIGGALKAKDTVISKVYSQADISLTILNQLNIKPAISYNYSHDVFAKQSDNLALFVFNNGFGLVTDSSKISYDYNEHKVKFVQGPDSIILLRNGKAYIQHIYKDFMYRKK